MDPSQAAQDIFESFMMRQWFVAAVLIVDIVFLVSAFLWVFSKFEKIQSKIDAKLDKLRVEENKERDRWREELKQIVHNDNGVIGTNSLSLQAAASTINGYADRVEDQTDSIKELIIVVKELAKK